MDYIELFIRFILFVLMCGVTVKRFIESNKNKGLSLFVTICVLLNLIMKIVFLILK